MFDNMNILITGGTGSFGSEFVQYVLNNYKPKRLIVFSRDEMKQWEMAKKFAGYACLRFFIGDVREKDRLHRALANVDFVIHAAATKIVPTAEYNPFECVKTNVVGAMNLIDATIDQKVKKVVALSTDKASSPINLYGATKLASDKLFTASNAYVGEHGTKFSVVRYGNVANSRGSVIPLFREQSQNNHITITDYSMTRFLISLSEAIKTVILAFKEMEGSEIFVRKIPSIKILELAKCIAPRAEFTEIGIRPGEKLHEQLISVDESRYTYEFKDYYKILSPLNNWNNSKKRMGEGKQVQDGFSYASDTNGQWLSGDKLNDWLENFEKC
ncbi:MAG: UDP-N-acetylglucosamine 4,6-dehydratase (inverting) [Crocinitomicaceae bacterium TMED209]|nr:MAG: UDP-N-acetylglucosamine 4,6-dehydratase (inverting) [Candidatus Endolissoclinum sp. TMED37]RPG88487.1 MAG: UDP-N-acetylglucosamine 4,6-dehydratase (inverting) [Crocinitomicaceae bacterium TMED209]